MQKNIFKTIIYAPKTYWKEIIAFLVVLLAFVFFRNERKELQNIVPQLKQADIKWILAGLFITFLYIFLQAFMYVTSFKALNLKLLLSDAIELFLKRNFLSVFFPAGGISSLAYTPAQLRRKHLNAGQIHLASAIYAYIGLLTVFLIGIPVILYTILSNRSVANAGTSLLVLGGLLFLLLLVFYSLRSKKFLYKYIDRKFPRLTARIDNFFGADFNRKYIILTIIISTFIELCGIAHVCIAMKALHLPWSLEAGAVAYTISVILMILSPFLRGLGAVEFSMVFILAAYNYQHSSSLGITLLYRLFEFWIPLFMGFISFIWRGRHLVARIIPAFSSFILGLLNIISVATPPLMERLRLEKTYLPVQAEHSSKLMVLMLGISLLITAAYLIRGLRSAWIAAIIFASLSLLGHIGKALDYEEAIVSGFIIIILLLSKNQYRSKSAGKIARLGLTTFFTSLLAVCIFNTLSFYLIDRNHFGTDFTWRQSIYHTAKSFFLFSDSELQPKTVFGRDFLYIIRFLGFGCWLLLIYTLLKPRKLSKGLPAVTELQNARELLNTYGNSAVDYFKLTGEKQFFFPVEEEGFVSFRTANNYAVVLEGPVCSEEDIPDVLGEFEAFCEKNALKTAYYRVDESDLHYYNEFRKYKLFIGQEAIMDIQLFKLEGKDKKSLRNGLNSLEKKGYNTELLSPPHSNELLKELQQISDEWLEKFEKREMVFSQGMFEMEALRNQEIIVVKEGTGGIVSFMNIIPDYTPEECTYDLIRKKEDAPGGCMDAMIIGLWQHAREKKLKFLNLGFVPLSGNISPDNPAEQIMKMASRRLGSLKHFQTQRNFKEKYASIWQNKYLIFSNDFDLLELPVVLNKVMRP